MDKLDGVRYELLDYSKYRDRIKEVLFDDRLIELGIDKKVIGKTFFGYDLDCITVGNGNKHLFIVGGTHGSEIISVDFVTQLISEVKNFKNFDPNEFKLFIIPLQNPEGFVVSTDSLEGKNVGEDLTNKGYEYYEKYKVDNIIAHVIVEFNKMMVDLKKNGELNTSIFLRKFNKFISGNNWMMVLKKMFPDLDRFILKLSDVRNISDVQYLKASLIRVCDECINYYGKDLNNRYLMVFVSEFKNYFVNNSLFDEMSNKNIIKFHQDMFKDVGFDEIRNRDLGDSVRMMYNEYGHVLGSQVTYDATGLGINLNANHRLNPGMNAIRNDRVVMGLGARNNLRNYVPGPIGVPTIDVNDFQYATENKALYDLIKMSYDSGNYYGTLLYHGTGGMIFYKPYQKLMSDDKYKMYDKYNYEMADIYSKSTGYKLINSSDSTGYGDLLRRTFPGVLLIELSKMGGNPIAPYGDRDGNFYNTFVNNYRAFDEVLGYISKKYNSDDVKKNIR